MLFEFDSGLHDSRVCREKTVLYLSDVSCFGALLLEMVNGKGNKSFHHAEFGESLLTHAFRFRYLLLEDE